MMHKIKYFKSGFLLICAALIHSCEWRVEDQPGYWVITFPQDGATCNEVVTIGIDANDPDGICGVEINVNDLKIDIPLSEILGKINDEPIEISLNTNDLPDGPVEISVTICDCNDNCTESPPITYTIDNTLSVPDTINITSTNFINSGFDIKWEKSDNGDFYQYDLYHSINETLDDTSLIFSSNNIDQTNFFMENTDPFIFNYFYVIVSDTFNYSTKGDIYSSSLEALPDSIEITDVNYINGGFNITWERSTDNDFQKYDLYHSINESLVDSSLIFSSNNIENVTYFMENADPLIINYFYIIVSDSTNFSTKSNIYSSTIDPRPNPIHIQSVTYNDITMDILWDESLDGDFLKYELYKGLDTTNTNLLETFLDKQITSYSINDFNPYTSNFFRIIVYDTLNQNTKGNFLSNTIQPAPEPVDLDPIDSFGNEFSIVWSIYPSDSFERYNLYQAYDIDMTNKEIIFTTTDRSVNTYSSIDNDYETDYYFQVSIIDNWGYEVYSNIEYIDTEYFTFIHNYDSGSDGDIGYYGIQNASDKYKIIAKTSLDVVMASTDRYGSNLSFNSFNYEIDESPVKLLQTDNQDYIFISNIVNSSNDTDIRITKTDQNGGVIWNTVYGFIDPYNPGAGNATYGNDLANDISITADGGYILTGRYHSSQSDILILKLNSVGEIENIHQISTAPSSQRIVENGHAILENINNNYVILGSISAFSSTQPSNVWLAEFDPNQSESGEIIWSSTWDIDNYDYPKSMIINQNGEYTISGYSSNDNNGDNGSSWIIKTDINGNGEVLQPFTGNNFVFSMIEIESGDYILAGKKIEDSNSQGWIVSVDSEGNQNWERLYGGDDVEVFYSIQQTSDMGYIITGETNSNGVSDIYHVKTDPYGEVITTE